MPRWPTLLLALAGSLLTSQNSLAECECLWEGSFADVQADTDLVISGHVIATKGNSIDLAIDQKLRGGHVMSEVRVWLKTLDYCRPEPALFPEQSQWVMALYKITDNIPGGFNPSTPNMSYGRIGDYRLSSCGGYWLSQSENLVTGNLIEAPRWVRDPDMTPVLLDLLADYVSGTVGTSALLEASRQDPELRNLMLDTKAFLREEN
ncbi:MAG: delta-aminolevulinic acid dehydratase [Halioglobus sp.]